jgi:hypothetical protein
VAEIKQQPMSELGVLYSRLLGFGLLSVREAVRCGDLEWAEAEVELLHNIPSLVEEPNAERHRYFWFSEREAYIECVNSSGREAAERNVRIFYQPVWDEMEPVLLELLSCNGVTK